MNKMCGIVGYIGSKKAVPILIQGLKKLEYRGYDSAGISYIDNKNQVKIHKSVGRISNLEKKVPLEENTNIGIGHTRWATHGIANETNSHPHQVGSITIVHNGILENYQELKEKLIKAKYHFKSNTDTEVACAYIDYLYHQNQNIQKVFQKCIENFEGSYAIVALIKDYPNQLFILKKDSPLVIEIGNHEFYIASDISTYANNTSKYITLEDKEFGIIEKDKIKLYLNEKQITPKIKKINNKYQDSNKQNFQHHMLKEIYEQENLIKEWNNYYLKQNNIKNLPNLENYQKIHIIGCGTAYHAGLIGKYLLEEYANIETEVFIASEYRYQKLFLNQNTCVIAISQSGETADTLACIKRVKEKNIPTIGIINVQDSSIARLVDEVIYTNAGPEIAVASTKAYTAQIYTLIMLVLKIITKQNQQLLLQIKESYQNIPSQIHSLIKQNYSSIVNILNNYQSIFYLGRNLDYITTLEGSLKLKEITYIHSEAMPAGELKHGTISLMDENSCIVALTTQKELVNKTISNIKEVKSRNAKIILLATSNLKPYISKDCYDEVLWLPQETPFTQPIINIIPLQIIAYEVAKRKGLDIDKPRNLAKSVTVE
jgi:glucosamine--fructose-6-phosphate aminotransferase (isomerizing)